MKKLLRSPVSLAGVALIITMLGLLFFGYPSERRIGLMFAAGFIYLGTCITSRPNIVLEVVKEEEK